MERGTVAFIMILALAAVECAAGVLGGDLGTLADLHERGLVDEPTAQVEVTVALADTTEATLAAARSVLLEAATTECAFTLKGRVLVARLRELSALPGVSGIARPHETVPAPSPDPGPAAPSPR